MATRRTAAKVKVPDAPTTNTTRKTADNLVSAPLGGSPLLPTPVEAILLGLYPATLVLGSVISSVQPAARKAVYSAISQSYLPDQAPSYFAKKSNIFNVYFVKVGWLWVTLAFTLLIFTHPSLGTAFQPKLNRRRIQALLRYACVTAVWIAVTQWFFGPAIIDRSFRWTGGQCEVVLGDSAKDHEERAEMSDVREVFTHAACKTIGGQWAGGHDISGHVFLLILGSAALWLELLPAILRTQGLREARRVKTADGLVRSASVESTGDSSDPAASSGVQGIGSTIALAVAGLSWWMLLMTAAYFHTWFEKFTGFLVAIVAIYAVYFLPRGVPAWRSIIGLPGV